MSMEYVVLGTPPQGRSGGVVRCEFATRGKSYDHERHHAAAAAGHPRKDVTLPKWDFVVLREDGSGIRLHPRWSETKIPTFAVAGHEVQVEPPRRGPGTSDGPGTYKKYKIIGDQMTLRFDANKRPPVTAKAKTKAKAQAKAKLGAGED